MAEDDIKDRVLSPRENNFLSFLDDLTIPDCYINFLVKDLLSCDENGNPYPDKRNDFADYLVTLGSIYYRRDVRDPLESGVPFSELPEKFYMDRMMSASVALSGKNAPHIKNCDKPLSVMHSMFDAFEKKDAAPLLNNINVFNEAKSWVGQKIRYNPI